MNECPKGAAPAQSSAHACPVVTQGAGCGLPCAGLVCVAPEPLGGGWAPRQPGDPHARAEVEKHTNWDKLKKSRLIN